MANEDYTDKDAKDDIAVLHGMGYAQELSRSMSKFSNFAISFSIICILSGGINSFAQAISSVGGAGAGIGWIVGCVISGMFALAMAQIASDALVGLGHRSGLHQRRRRVFLCGHLWRALWLHRHTYPSCAVHCGDHGDPSRA